MKLEKSSTFLKIPLVSFCSGFYSASKLIPYTGRRYTMSIFSPIQHRHPCPPLHHPHSAGGGACNRSDRWTLINRLISVRVICACASRYRHITSLDLHTSDCRGVWTDVHLDWDPQHTIEVDLLKLHGRTSCDMHIVQTKFSVCARNNSGQVVHTHVPLFTSSIKWYRRKLGAKKALRDTLAGVWLRATCRNADQRRLSWTLVAPERL